MIRGIVYIRGLDLPEIVGHDHLVPGFPEAKYRRGTQGYENGNHGDDYEKLHQGEAAGTRKLINFHGKILGGFTLRGGRPFMGILATRLPNGLSG